MIQNKKLTIIATLLGLVFLILLLVLLLFPGKETPADQSLVQETQIELKMSIIDKKDIRQYLIKTTNNKNLMDILTEYDTVNNEFSFETEKLDFGFFITTINGLKADSSSEFWSFEINSKPSQVGIMDYYPKNGDNINFTLTSF